MNHSRAKLLGLLNALVVLFAPRFLAPSLLALSFLAPSFLALDRSTTVRADDLPVGVVDTQDPSDVSLTPQESLARIRVPDGFHVSLFAAEPDIRRPIAFDIDDRGRLWVVENYSHPNWKAGEGTDRIIILEDTNHDGEFDERTVFWDKGRYLTAIAVGHGGVWVGNTPELMFIPDKNRDDVPDSDPIVKLDGFQISNNNVLNNFHWGPDGWLYGAIGLATKSFVGAPGTAKKDRTMITRGMWRYHPYDGRFEVLARGMVNPWGADFNAVGDLFTSNTVIAHLWHIVPGMYCERRGFERDNRYVYSRIQSIADHLHWGGGKWTSSRVTDHGHDDAGGGHAHCGAMIYLGDNWPDKYRGQFFTGNLHGNRINNDKLVPDGSSYVGVHQPDFLFANDPWFRTMTQKYGPDGGVFVSDWHDFGECHDKDGSHRSSGRIYKVVFGSPEKRNLDLQTATNLELAKLHTHKNEWIVRHARLILHERWKQTSSRSIDDRPDVFMEAIRELRSQLIERGDVIQRLRAFWTLALLEQITNEELVRSCKDDATHVRRWAGKILTDRRAWNEDSRDAIRHLALDSEASVRLVAACALPYLPNDLRWDVAANLLSHADADDAYLPLMTWYGIEPIVPTDRAKAFWLAEKSSVPLLKEYIVRRLAEGGVASAEQIVRFISTLPVNGKGPAMQGWLAALDQSKVTVPPKSWQRLYGDVKASNDPKLNAIATRIAVSMGDQAAISQLRMRVVDKSLDFDKRQNAFEVLRSIDAGLPSSLLRRLVERPSPLRHEAIAAFANEYDQATSAFLLAKFAEFNRREKQEAIAVLVARADTANDLLRAIETGDVDRLAVSAYALQQLRIHKDEEVQSRIHSIWATDSDDIAKADEISRYKKLLSKEFLATANPGHGRQLFEATCAKCHKLFGEGSDLAPELTGSGRADKDYVLSNLVDPSGLVDPSYRLTTIITDEGRIYQGFMVRHTEEAVVLRTQQGEVRLSMAAVESLSTSNKSMMPDGLLKSYSIEQIRDLVSYLASPEQVPLPTE